MELKSEETAQAAFLSFEIEQYGNIGHIFTDDQWSVVGKIFMMAFLMGGIETLKQEKG